MRIDSIQSAGGKGQKGTIGEIGQRYNARMTDALLTITDLEAAINFWRARSPAEGEELRLCAEASALAKPYALMIVQGATRIAPEQLGDKARAAYEAWRAATQG
jgi:hypothetical protein